MRPYIVNRAVKDGKVVYEVKAGTQTDTRIRLKGKGVPSLIAIENEKGEKEYNVGTNSSDFQKIETKINEYKETKLKEYTALKTAYDKFKYPEPIKLTKTIQYHSLIVNLGNIGIPQCATTKPKEKPIVIPIFNSLRI